MKLYLGLDLGAVSIKAAVLNENGKVVYVHPYLRHNGHPLYTLKLVLKEIYNRFGDKQINTAAATGSGRALATKFLGIHAVNDVKASWLGCSHIIPYVSTVIEIGGKDAKLLRMGKTQGDNSRGVLKDFACNTLCAAGTGSFLDQQALRLGYSVEEFGQIALKSNNPSTISGRCSVFAKSDLIHLQQIGTPDYDMLAGLCFAITRNFISSVGKAKKLMPPVVFIGGVAANVGVVKAFRQLLNLKEEELIIPSYYYALPAIGAALEASRLPNAKSLDFSNLVDSNDDINYQRPQRGLERLELKASVFLPGHNRRLNLDSNEITDVFLGIDVGSISTKVVLIDTHGRLVTRRYLLTSGRPIEAVRQGIAEISREVDSRLRVRAAATTGSGRYLIGDFIGADMVINEITTQSTAALHIDPEVDTIFEIGGQDSKFIVLKDGAVVDFTMNKVCAAGTGSFLEEQAEKMKISIKDEFSHLAFESEHPIGCGQRCTVFMESDLNEYLQLGFGKNDIAAGLAYSIVKNYLNTVADRSKIGSHIFFQGAVAYNHAVVSAFEKELGRSIIVPPNHDVTGAIGAALIARKRMPSETKFRGFNNIINQRYTLNSFVCQGCSNSCEIKKVEIEGKKPLYYGDRCDTRYQRQESSPTNNLPDLFDRRDKFLFEDHITSSRHGKKIGIPRALLSHEYLPQWKTFFTALGHKVVVSDKTTTNLINSGAQTVATETCLPVKAYHGHVLNLLEKDLDYLFLPVVMDQKKHPGEELPRYNCPYVQITPFILHAGLNSKFNNHKILSPILFYHLSEKIVTEQLLKVGRKLGNSKKQIYRAIKLAEQAQSDFRLKMEEEGEKILNTIRSDERAFVIFGRSYNTCDDGLNLQVARKLRHLGILPIPMDFLPISRIESTLDWGNMYWHCGRRILTAAKIVAEDKRLYAVYITNFRCGPDSFILPFFKEIMADKPFLQLEFDDHQADTGMVTRLEAFLDSIMHNRIDQDSGSIKKSRWPFILPPSKEITRKKVYIPHMGDHAFSMAAAFKAFGLEAEVMRSDEETLKLGRKFTSSKECLPYVITVGDLVKHVSVRDFDPSKAVFFMPSTSGPCRFGLYHAGHRLILEKLNLGQVEIISPNQADDFCSQLGISGMDFSRHCWKGIVAIELLDKLLRKTRPYEKNKDETEKVYQLCLEDVINDLSQGNDPESSLIRAKEAFSRIKVNKDKNRPLIGIIGEIFVRMHKFTNDNVIKKIESLGGEVLMPPMQEWIYHVNRCALLHNQAKRKWKSYFAAWLKDRIMKMDEHRLEKTIKGRVEFLHEPPVSKLWKNAEHYFLPWYGEASLGLGKSKDYLNKGVKGIVQLMPFTCMIGTICKTQLKRFKEDHPNVAVVNLEFDGQAQSSLQDELESFMEHVKSL